MDIHLIIKLKSSYDAWHKMFANHLDVRSKICDESRTLVGKADESTALVTLFNVDVNAMAVMMADPEFVKMNANFVDEIFPYSIIPLNPSP